MRELVADRLEDGLLVCFGEDGERASLPCPPIARPEGRRVLVFEALAAMSPYVRIDGAIESSNGASFAVLPPDGDAASEARRQLDNLLSR